MRCFVAVCLAPAIQDALAEAAAGLFVPNRGFRSISPENLHITLQFLGEVPLAEVVRVQQSLLACLSGVPSFPLELGGSGAFPDPKRPRILWIGMREGAGKLKELATRVSGGLRPLGIEPDKPFSPHVTVARARAPKAAGLLPGLSPEQVLATLTVDAVHLMQSELLPEGARYSSRLRVPLEPEEK